MAGISGIVRSLQTTSAGDRLIVTMSRTGDRLAHRVLLAAQGRSASPLVESWEDQQSLAWPASPPYQQMDQCVLADGREGLVGVGMAGTSHWSVAIESHDDSLWWDVACRVQREPEFLGSVYRVRDSECWEARESEPAVARGRVLNDGRQIVFRWDPATTEVHWPQDALEFEVRPRQWPESFPATVRWKYGFTLSPA